MMAATHPFGQFQYPTSPERVGLKRKQQAIRSVGSLATDANGSPAPFTSPTAYQRASVAVPFGNCTEPSNVTASDGASEPPRVCRTPSCSPPRAGGPG